LQPTQRRSLVARRIGVRQELAELERVGERKAAHLSGRYLGVLNVPAVDGPVEASVCCAGLVISRDGRWGNGWFRTVAMGSWTALRDG
jgi:hypothetical protein